MIVDAKHDGHLDHVTTILPFTKNLSNKSRLEVQQKNQHCKKFNRFYFYPSLIKTPVA